LVEEKVKSYFVDAVLFGDFQEGGTALAEVEDDDIVIRKTGAAAQPDSPESAGEDNEGASREAPVSSDDDRGSSQDENPEEVGEDA
jgi:hypothetical protein